MTDPTRLLDEGGDDLGSRLLRTGKASRPRPASMERALVAASLAAASSAAVGKVAGAAGGALLSAKWAVVGIATVGLVALGAATLAPRSGSLGSAQQVSPPERRATPVTNERTAETTSEPLASTDSTATQQATADVKPTPPPAHRAAAPTARRQVTSPPAAVAAAVPETPATASQPSAAPTAELAANHATLAEELTAMDEARRAVAARRPAHALRILDDYAANYPRARFAQEAFVLRIEALVQSGQRSTALTLARRFLASYPKSTAARKVRALVGISD